MNPFKAILDLLYPKICFVCGERLNADETVLCSKCEQELPRTWEVKYRQNKVENAFSEQEHFVRGAAFCFYKKNSAYSHLIHQMKYNDNDNGFPEIGEYLGEMAAKEFSTANPLFFDNIDLIIPIPLHPKKLRKRSYNQTEYIAQGLSKIVHIPVDNSHIIKQLNNNSQTTKSTSERLHNTQNAYTILNAEELAGKHVLLVDDIITTGATMKACMECLDTIPDIRYSVFALGVATSI